MPRFIGVMLSKNYMFLLMGLCLGFCINSLFSLFIEKSCLLQHRSIKFDSKSYHHQQLFGSLHVSRTDSYIIRYKSKKELENINSTLRNDIKLRRPRFLSSELDIKDTILNAVLTSSNTYKTAAVAISKTFLTKNSKLLFFMNFDSSNISVDGLSFVIFTHSTKHLLPFLTLKHLAEKHIEHFHWFCLFHDSTYVNKEALDELVDRMRVGDVVVMALSNEHNLYGDLRGGILISQAALKLISNHLDECLGVVRAENSDYENIKSCFTHTINATFSTVKESKIGPRSIKDEAGSDVISYRNLTTSDNIYHLHRKFTEKNIKKYSMKLEELKERINKIPTIAQPYAWPYGSEALTPPRDRFDLVRWQYFTKDTLYHDQLEDNYMHFTASCRKDVQNILKKIILKLNEDTQNKMRLKQLLNGYRRFDSARGVDYIMDLELQREEEEDKTMVKRVHYFKQLSNVQMVKTPLVTEHSMVTLLLVTSSHNKKFLLNFLKMFVEKCLKKEDNSELFIVITYEDSLQELERFHTVLKNTISFYEKKILKKGIIKYMFFKDTVGDHTSMLRIIDEISKTLLTTTLISLCSLGMELKIDYLKHIRMNTIQGFQVYFPIGFWTYEQNLPSDSLSPILLNQKSGSYQDGIFQHCSFHLSDYLSAAKNVAAGKKRSETLLEMFSQYHLIKVLKGVDSALRISTGNFHCFKNDIRCFTRRRKALTNKSRMTNEIFKINKSKN